MKLYETPQMEVLELTTAQPIAAEGDTSVLITGSQLMPKV